VLSAVATEKNKFTPEHEGLMTRCAWLAAPFVERARVLRMQQMSRAGDKEDTRS
jgi:hypothetical protein